MPSLETLLEASAALHRHLCPRQVLGVRIGLLGGELLGLSVPQTTKRLLTIVETDGCAADGVSTATHCWVGRRTLRVEDLGKVAATFVDTVTGRAVRVWPQADVRARAAALAPEARNRWEGQLLGYQRLPSEHLLAWCEVELRDGVAALISRPGLRATCDACGEEILNGRELIEHGRVLCRTCAHDGDHPAPYFYLRDGAHPSQVRQLTPGAERSPR